MPTEAAPSHVFAPELESVGATLRLSPEESHYLQRVCRVRAGDRVSATDGRGGRATLRVTQVRAPVLAEIESLERVPRRRHARVLCGAPEGTRADWLVEKLAELGIGDFHPIQCARGEWLRADDRLERWRRLARAALRQSRGCFEMTVHAPAPLEAALDRLPVESERWLAEPSGPAASSLHPAARGAAAGTVGPAGGFAADERARLEQRGFRAVSLAGTRLRTETAALAWAAWWAAVGETE